MSIPKEESKARDSRLLKCRSLFLGQSVIAERAKQIITDLLYLDQENHDPIYFYINSPGGEVNSGLAIYDTLRYLESPVTVINMGLCASIATVLNVSVPLERRLSLPHCRFLLHQPLTSGSMRATASDLEIAAAEMDKTREALTKILSEGCAQPYEKLYEDTQRDYWLSAQEAVNYGLVKKIVHRKSEV